MNWIRLHGLMVGGLVFVAVASYLFIQPEPRLQNKINLDVIPMNVGQYAGEDITDSIDGLEEALRPDAILFRNYFRGTSSPVTLCLVYNYARRSTSFHDPYICYPAQGYTLHDQGARKLSVAGQDVTASVVKATKNSQDYLVVYWYLSGKDPIHEKGGRQGHLLTFVKSRVYRTLGVSTMVRVSAPIANDIDETYAQLTQFLRDVYPRILSVEADLAQAEMPGLSLWNSGAAGRAGVILALIVPAAIAVMGVGFGVRGK